MSSVDDHLKELKKDPEFKKSYDKEIKLLKNMPEMYCPICGTNPLGLAPYYIKDPFTDHDTSWVGYDCYCEGCRWSGIIETDEEVR